MAQRHGLEWVQNPSSLQYRWEESSFGLEPRWTMDPSISVIEALSRHHLQLVESARCTVTFHAQGGFNKLYLIETDAGTSMMRIALPLDPHRKTASEVATMEFVRSKTVAPVPKVLAHDTSNHNALGFEWILMEYMPGRPLRQAWRRLSMFKKEALVKQLALYQSQLYLEKFQSIGNLYQGLEVGSYDLGSIVSMTFFWGDRGTRHVPRGPFRNSYEWLSARLSLLLEDQDCIMQTTNDEDAFKDAESAKSLAEQLIAILPSIFPPDKVESSIIFHDDAHEQNILISEDGDLAAILDWECVSALPIWKACQPPALLEGCTRDDEPRRESYRLYDPEIDEGDAEENQGIASLYWEHLLEYERGQLRRLFLFEMKRLQPEWVREYRQGELKRDFELAVLYSDGEFTIGTVEAWLDAYKKGEEGSLREKLNA